MPGYAPTTPCVIHFKDNINIYQPLFGFTADRQHKPELSMSLKPGAKSAASKAKKAEAEGAALALPGDQAAPRKSRKLFYFLPLAVLPLIGGGLWFSGVIPHFLHPNQPVKQADTKPVFVKMPEIITNLDAGDGNDSYVKLKISLEVAGPQAAQQVTASIPRLVDLFQSYLRAMHPDELRGAVGTYRLREAMIARANVAAAPVVINNVLFDELIVQ